MTISHINVSSKAKISAIGTYIPKKKITNFDLEKMVETSDEWIVQRTGIRERRIAHKNEFTSDLCVSAIKEMKNNYDITHLSQGL